MIIDQFQLIICIIFNYHHVYDYGLLIYYRRYYPIIIIIMAPFNIAISYESKHQIITLTFHIINAYGNMIKSRYAMNHI
jgi:hypothetical protein